MTAELLTLLSDGKTHSQHELAECLNTTPESVMARIDFLHRAGYMKQVCMPQICGKKCAGCSIQRTNDKGQTPGNCPVLWELVK